MTSNITSNHNTMDSLKITPWCSLDTLHGFTTFTVLWNIWNMKGKVIVNFTFTAWIKKAMWAQPGRGPIREKQERDALQSWKEAIFWQVVILHTSLCTALHCLLHCVIIFISASNLHQGFLMLKGYNGATITIQAHMGLQKTTRIWWKKLQYNITIFYENVKHWCPLPHVAW